MKSPLNIPPASNRGQENVTPETMKRIEPATPRAPITPQGGFPLENLTRLLLGKKNRRVHQRTDEERKNRGHFRKMTSVPRNKERTHE